MLCEHINNRYTSGNQWLRKLDKNKFVFTVAIARILKRGAYKFRESLKGYF